jgi:16S rRNA (adenine1518-N6/adenine1519-N6)-dimethyltransferase
MHPKKSLGQNFLVDESVIAKIVAAAGLGPSDAVLEIGPGLGAMTRPLAGAAGHVAAVELDEGLLLRLKDDLKDLNNIDFIHGDALKFPYEGLPRKVKVVANLPYYISTPIITRLIGAREKITTMLLMLQKEVARRITAQPGGREYGYISVMVQLYTEARLLFDVPNWAFNPVPKVDSAVVKLVIRDEPAAKVKDYALFEKVVGASFSHRRKTLKNTLKASGLFTDEGLAAMGETGIDPSRRAETLTVAEFGKLADFLFEFRRV